MKTKMTPHHRPSRTSRVLFALTGLALLAATASPAFAAGVGNVGNPDIMPPQSHPYGLSYAEWAARYWQWLGRSGVHGRLPTSRCIDAFVKSEKIFQSLDDWRHVHACRRMRAEALLDNFQLQEAKEALLEAQAMEAPDWSIADRMRRMKVQAILAAKLGQNKTWHFLISLGP